MAARHDRTVSEGRYSAFVIVMQEYNGCSRTQKEYYFSQGSLLKNLASLTELGITEICVRDPVLVNDKVCFLNFISEAVVQAPDVFFTLYIPPLLLDREICSSLSNLSCSIQMEIPVVFDRRLLARRAVLLNSYGLVFGFDFLAGGQNETVKQFRFRLDFLISLYPNHIYFPCLEDDDHSLKTTAVLSSQDIKTVKRLAYACDVFYSAGRAVSWFLSLLKALSMSAHCLFSDFAEWQYCNNCGLTSSFIVSRANHLDIEKMQLAFLELKCEEKNRQLLYPAIRDCIMLNGALSRAAGEGEESLLELYYQPDDLLGVDAVDLNCFVENVYMEPCQVKVFVSDKGPEYIVVQ